MSEKEKRIRAITNLYYSNPKVQDALLKFAKDREVVPSYMMESFGKRPDMIQYASDINGLVKRGATSFHASEELWNDPLQLNSEMTFSELNQLRKGWDLLIDIDSKYLDLSRESAKLVIEFLERFGIRNYGLKFSGSKGFHLIISGKAFPAVFDGKETREMFPEWPRAIVGYMFNQIKPEFRKRVGKLMSFSSLKQHEEMQVTCKNCGSVAEKSTLDILRCAVCDMKMERKDAKGTRKKIRCLNKDCAGSMEVEDSITYYFCKKCMDPAQEKFPLNSNKYPEMFEQVRGEAADEHADFDLVLVASRHLFRMPYSLHEKTSLASAVLTRKDLDTFGPKDADPLKIVVKDFMPANTEGEARKLLSAALDWKKGQETKEKELDEKKYSGKPVKSFEFKDVSEDMFPPAIQKLLKGLEEGRKRGLFVLLTFLRSLNFSPDEINKRVHAWNEKNKPPLKEGYVRSQVDWHLKQKKNIMPPNYSNEAFYRDIGLIDKLPETKNPLVDVMRKMRKRGEDF